MKLELGMYVRTDDGYIFQIKQLLEKGKYNDSDNKIVQRFRIDGIYQKNEDYIESNYIYSDWVKKVSHNIIDLIEIGDYVNGSKVYYCYCADEDSTDLFIDTEKGRQWLDKPSQVKSIVTKEMFSSVECRMETD